MGEFYSGGGGQPHMTLRQIQQMKKNMAKVGTIKDRAKKYHEQEQQDIDRLEQQFNNL